MDLMQHHQKLVSKSGWSSEVSRGMSLLGAGLIYGRGEKWWNLLGRPDKVRHFNF